MSFSFVRSLPGLVGAAALLAGIFLAGCGSPAQSQKSSSDGVVAPQATEPAPAEWELSTIKDPRLFTTTSGIRVEVAPLVSTSDASLTGYYLTRITGTQDEFEGVVFVVQRSKRGSYMTTIRGQPRTIIFQQERARHAASGFSGWYLQKHTGRYEAVKLEIGDGKEVDAEALLARLAAQHASGLMKKIAPTDRASRERAQQQLLDEYINDDEMPCGPLKVEIDWQGVEDSWFDEVAFGSLCSTAMHFLEPFCEQFPHRRKEVRAAGPIRCEFPSKPEKGVFLPPRRNKSGELVFAPTSGTYDSREHQERLRTFFGESHQVLKGQKSYFIIRDEPSRSRAVYNGDGKTFYPNGQLLENAGSTYLDLYSGSSHAVLRRKGASWSLQCGTESEELELLKEKERDALMAVATFKEKPVWLREPYFLARDTKGIYYYVDRYAPDYGGKRYRVFRGRRGQLRLTKLKGVVEDTVGTVFSTSEGDLRLVVDEQSPSALWIRGRKKFQLTLVNIHRNRSLIFDELGAYFGEDLGFVCDK